MAARINHVDDQWFWIDGRIWNAPNYPRVRQCPYYESHIYTVNQHILHLNECRKNYIKEKLMKKEGIEVFICKHNKCHHIKKDELEIHEQNCPTHLDMEEFKEKLKNMVFPPSNEVIEGGEVWEPENIDSDPEDNWEADDDEGCRFEVPEGLTVKEREEFAELIRMFLN